MKSEGDDVAEAVLGAVRGPQGRAGLGLVSGVRRAWFVCRRRLSGRRFEAVAAAKLAEQSGINRWVEVLKASHGRSHDSSRMRSDVRAVAVDDNSSTTRRQGGTDWCVRLWDARTYSPRARWAT